RRGNARPRRLASGWLGLLRRHGGALWGGPAALMQEGGWVSRASYAACYAALRPAPSVRVPDDRRARRVWVRSSGRRPIRSGREVVAPSATTEFDCHDSILRS